VIDEVKRSGFVAIIGRPNVGKSTLLNTALGKKICITSRKPQTTRQRMLGIKTSDASQIVYVDTPGLHSGQKKELNRYMNRVAKSALHEVDVVVFMVQALAWTKQETIILSYLESLTIPVVLVINKIDLVKDKQQLLPFIDEVSSKFDFAKIIPVSARQGSQVDCFENDIISFLPAGNLLYPPEQFTDRSDKFVVAEFVREKLTRQLGDEIPYALTTTIESMEEESNIIRIACLIWIDKESQKHIVIGEKGSRLKQVGIASREDLERYFNKKVFLQLWVKVKSGWSDDADMLNRFGYEE
jgi:GTPase